MMREARRACLRLLQFLLVALLVWSAPAAAAEPTALYRERADGLVSLLNAKTRPETLFSPAFLAQVPPAQVASISKQLRDSYGAAREVERIEVKTPTSGMVVVRFERAAVKMDMAIGPAPPHLIEGLLVTGAEMAKDHVRTVFGELTALPGTVSLAAARLDAGGVETFLTQKADEPLPVGSSFKLFILAELVRQVKAGERRWADVVPLGAPSLPSGILQDWPAGSPVTLHSLAALMISRSDNSATDTLLAVVGRDKVEALLPALGVRAPERNRPFLSTRDMFALKLGDPALTAEWLRADEPGRRRMLPRLEAVAAKSLDVTRLAGAPMQVDKLEWFASASDLVRTLDWIRRSGDATARALLGINPGLSRDQASAFGYVGFKGGSEPGVLNLSYLIQSRDGRWFALSGTWNNPAAPLEETRFVALMQRLAMLTK
jgi:hypothetical protein